MISVFNSVGAPHTKMFSIAGGSGIDLVTSAQFNGSSWLLNTTNTYNIGTGQFTFEAWCFLSQLSGGTQGFFGLGTTSAFITILYNDRGAQRWSVNVTNAPTKVGDTTGCEGKGGWQHIAVCRSASDNKLRLFIDGVIRATSASAVNTNFSFTGIQFGRAFQPPSANVFPVGNGHRISGVRLSNVDRYGTSSFTPSKKQFTHDGNSFFVFNFNQATYLQSDNGATTLTNTNTVYTANGPASV